MGVLNITSNGRVSPRFLRPLESLYKLCGVDLGDCLDEAIFPELRPFLESRSLLLVHIILEL